MWAIDLKMISPELRAQLAAALAQIEDHLRPPSSLAGSND
jgi:hypothetical protein